MDQGRRVSVSKSCNPRPTYLGISPIEFSGARFRANMCRIGPQGAAGQDSSQLGGEDGESCIKFKDGKPNGSECQEDLEKTFAQTS